MRPPPAKPSHSIVLVGLMAAGKSTIGRRLATRLGLPFVDADAEIEAAAGLSVAEIFAQLGEDHFRDLERGTIVKLIEGPCRVIATGGGAFIDSATRALILSRCTAIWLDGDARTLAERASRRGGRPLLEGGDSVAILEELAKARNPIYADAHFRVRGDETAVETIAEILAAR
jgi:shikimate kinase